MTKRGLILIITLIVTCCWSSSAMASQSAVNISTYTVRAGDNLWAIGNKLGISVSQLKTVNGLKSNNIRVGQVLKIRKTSYSNVISRSKYTVSRSGDNVDRTSIMTVSTNTAVTTAAKYLGTPYVWGGSSPSGFDCSGFVKYVMSQIGITLPHSAASQFNYGVAVDKSELETGDLVFFSFKAGSGIDHVGIYVGDGRFIHSSCPRDGGVIYSSLYSGSYVSDYVGAKRVVL